MTLPVDIEDLFPLSGLQQALLLHGLYAGKADQGFLHQRCRLNGPLKVEAFRQAWEYVIASEPILRTRFTWEGLDEPLQVVHRAVALTLTTIDWRDTPAGEHQNRLKALMAQDRAQGFALDDAPLTRLFLIRLADECHELLWSGHHLQIDGWSVPMIFQDVLTAYAQIIDHGNPQVAKRPSFRTYIDWLQNHDQGADERYWSHLLAGFAKPTPIAPHLLPDDAGATGPATIERVLDEGATASIVAFARARRVTLNIVIQTVWSLILSRYTNSSDVVFGTTVSGRPPELPGVETIIGPFINNLPVRVQLQPDDLLMNVLQRLWDAQLTVTEFEHAPLTRIHQWSEIAGHSRLFDSLVVFQNYPEADHTTPWGGVTMADSDGDITSAFPITLIAQGRRLLSITLVHDRSMCGTVSANQLLDEFTRLLQRLLEHSQATVAMLRDRIALPPTSSGGQHPGSSSATKLSIPPMIRTHLRPVIPLHCQLVDIWESLLGIQGISVDDNFFDLGGHSLLAAQMMHAVEHAFGRKLPMTTLLAGPTIERLASALMQQVGVDPRPLIELSAGHPGQTPFIYLHGDLMGGGYYSVNLARELGPETPFFVLSPVIVDVATETPSVEMMAAEHIRELRLRLPHGPYRLGGFCNGGIIAYEMACQLTAQGERVEFLALIEADLVWMNGFPWRFIISTLTKPLGVSHSRQVAFFGRLQTHLERWREIRARPLRSQMAVFLKKITHGMAVLTGRQRRTSTASPSVYDLGSGRLKAMDAYLWSLSGYHPKEYNGVVTVISSDDPAERPADPSMGWSRFSPHVVPCAVPGRHLELITKYVCTLARTLQALMHEQHDQTPALSNAPLDLTAPQT